MENKIIVYAKLNDKNEIIELRSSIFIDDISGWTKIDEGDGGDKYAHPEGYYFDVEKGELPLLDMNYNPNYKLVDGKITLVSDDEKLDTIIESNITPTLDDRVKSLEDAILTSLDI